MPQSLARVVLHVVFSTKNRVPFLKDPELRARLHAYMAGVLQVIGCEAILINGVEDCGGVRAWQFTKSAAPPSV